MRKALPDNKSDHCWWTTLSSLPQMVILCCRAVKKKKLSLLFWWYFKKRCTFEQDIIARMHRSGLAALYLGGNVTYSWCYGCRHGWCDHVVTGHWAAGHGRPVVEGCEAAEVTQLWLAGAQRGQASDDFTSRRRRRALIARWKSEGARPARSRERERTAGTSYNGPDGEVGSEKDGGSDWCSDCEEAVRTRRQSEETTSFYLYLSPFWRLIVSSSP